jgi:hypothetical protein
MHGAALSLLLLLASCARTELPAPGPTPIDDLPRSTPPVASYTLRAELDASEHVIHGSGEIRWVNSSAHPVQELYLHLYLNAFEGPQTLFYRNPARRARGGAPFRRPGHIQLERIVARQLADADLLPALEPHSPGDPQDGTDRRLPLPRPIAPGESLTLDVRWTSLLPELSIRTGFIGDFHFVGQWFPKLARLEPDGEWAHFPFDPLSEFYSDYGNYDVTLDVPEQMVVGATGHLSSESRSAGRRTLRYQVDSVHDFAWTAWPLFRQREERIAGIDVHLLYPPGYEHDAAVTLDVLRRALPHYGARYGSYPYADLTVVHPPAAALEAGGMEYPSLITTGGLWHESYWSRAVEYVTVHELGHQWFYGLLASNEHRWPFLDEGLNSYAESVALREFFGATASATPLGIELSGEALRRYVMLSRSASFPLALSAPDYPSMHDLGSIVYQRTALLFQTLANVYGEAHVAEGLRRYAVGQRFGHPTPDDLLAALAETLPPGALDNTRQALFEGHGVNYVLSELESAPLAGGLVESRVRVNRYGQLQFPVTLALRTAAGEQLTEVWDSAEQSHDFIHRGPSPIVSALIDPEVRVLLDDNLLDNAASAQPSVPLAPYERSLAALQWLGGLLGP